MFSLFFNASAWLWLLVTPILLGGVYWWRSQYVMRRWVSPACEAWMQLRHWSWRQVPWNWLVIWWLLVLALAQPMWLSPAQLAKHQPMKWVAIVDVSSSMATNDIQPSRLQQVIWQLESLSAHWQEGDQGALILYAGSAHWYVPFTHDHTLWLEAVKTLSVNMLPLQGSLLLKPLALLKPAVSENTTVVWFTDGGEMSEKDLQQLSTLRDKRLHGLMVGVGVNQPSQEPSSSFSPSLLQKVATRLHWSYQPFQPEYASQLLTWFDEVRLQQPVDSTSKDVAVSLQPWLLGLVLLLWFNLGRWQSRSLALWPLLFVGIAGNTASPMVEAATLEPCKVSLLLEQGKTALAEKRYEVANKSFILGFQCATEEQDQATSLLWLGKALSTQQQWFDAGQTFRAVLAYHPNNDEAKQALKTVVSHLLKQYPKLAKENKAGDSFEGVVSDWDEVSEQWETKDVLSESTASKSVISDVASMTTQERLNMSLMQQNSAQFAAIQQQRQDWVMAGEMKEKQLDKRLFYQRLFSLEAGFAAVQDQAKPIEGVSPW